MSRSGEKSFIEWICHSLPPQPHSIDHGPGDDTAIFHSNAELPSLITTDLLMEGVHFHLDQTHARRVGYKAMAVNLSDIAAMGGTPSLCVVSIALPCTNGRALGEELMGGLMDLAREFEVGIAGGDTNSWNGPLVVNITLLGQASRKGPLLRSTAKPGALLLVTGKLGGSLGGRHLDFKPRVRESRLLHDHYNLHAMIDVSDGLSTDLWHLLNASSCGACLKQDCIPIHDSVYEIQDARTPLEHALYDGEDFELLFTADPAEAARILQDQPLAIPITLIGQMTSEKEAQLMAPDGQTHSLKPQGWEHRLQ